MATQPINRAPAYQIRRMTPEHAPPVAGWVESSEELFWLAPGTPPPLTAEKVLGWTKAEDNPFLLFQQADQQPVGYAELNNMPQDAKHWWIGHVLVPRLWRRRGLGLNFVRLLLSIAFERILANRVSLVVFPQNEPAVHCYFQAGFTADGTHLKTFEHVLGEYRMLRMTMTSRQYQTLQRKP